MFATQFGPNLGTYVSENLYRSNIRTVGRSKTTVGANSILFQGEGFVFIQAKIGERVGDCPPDPPSPDSDGPVEAAAPAAWLPLYVMPRRFTTREFSSRLHSL